MVIISKVFTILCLLCQCGNREYPGSFQNKVSSKLFFQMSAQVKSVGWRRTSIDLSSRLSLTYGDNVDYYEIAHHPIPTLSVGTGNTWTTFKTNQ